jgi:hypothetical protein
LLALAVPSAAYADQAPTYAGPTNAAENSFVSELSQYLMDTYPTAADAEKAGFVRYTGVDDAGSISYAKREWTSSDYKHPCQLWYSTSGKLLGADYCVPVAVSPGQPNLWGINPGRWGEFNGHIHYVTKDPATGQMKYDQWVWEKTFADAGGDINNPSAATLVALHKVASADQVVTIFHFPSVWDLVVWAIPNPAGAFVWNNPNVKP